VGTFTAGDIAAMDPSLFAFTFIVEELKKAPETIRIVNVGSTDIKN